MRFRLLIAVLAVVAVSCGGGDGSADPVPATEAPAATSATSEAPATTSGSAPAGTESPSTEGSSTERPATEGPAAPAINTVLSDGTSFSLADEANPVYLVFWAEW